MSFVEPQNLPILKIFTFLPRRKGKSAMTIVAENPMGSLLMEQFFHFLSATCPPEIFNKFRVYLVRNNHLKAFSQLVVEMSQSILDGRISVALIGMYQRFFTRGFIVLLIIRE